MTNYEKIKQMSIDEMVQGDITLLGCVGHVPMEYCNKFHGNCIDCKKHWLESEVEENERY
jgi:hypothetical protein